MKPLFLSKKPSLIFVRKTIRSSWVRPRTTLHTNLIVRLKNPASCGCGGN